MPSGADAFQRRQQQRQEQKAAYDSGPKTFTNDFKIGANQYAIVRFLEQGDQLTFADTHRIPVQGKAKRYFKTFVCLDTNDDGTPCPGCQHSDSETARRTPRGFHNLIWRNGPVYQRDEKKRMVKDPAGNYIVIGREDQIALWTCSWTVHEMLREKDAKYKGLMSRDWEIKRTGSNADDTKYFIEPADPDGGMKPMLIGDLTLATQKYDLAEITRPLSFVDLAQILNRGAIPGQGPQPTMDRSAVLPTADSTFNQGGAQDPLVRASAFARG